MNPLFDIFGIMQPVWHELTVWVTHAVRWAIVWIDTHIIGWRH